jgi:N-acetylglucosamine transport system substrate-binding protein
MVYGMLMPWVQDHGGMSAVNACQNMTPNAWKSESVLAAAKMIEELRDKGFFEDGAVSLTHTQAQTDLINGKAAMAPCGTWIKSEMKEVLKPGQKLTFFLPPSIEGGKGDPSALQVDIEPWMVPVKAKNPQLGIDYYKFMTSLENAKAFVKEKGTFMSIKGSNDVDLPEELKAPAEAFKNSKTVWSIKFRQWYKSFEKELEDSVTALVSKKLSAAEFCERVEKAAKAVREDESIKKHKA